MCMSSRSRKKLLSVKKNGQSRPITLFAWARAQERRPEAHERIREWVSLRECLKRIEAWSTSSSTASDIASQGGVAVESSKAGKKGNKAKKEAKSAAMETALWHFVAARGLEEELSDT